MACLQTFKMIVELQHPVQTGSSIKVGSEEHADGQYTGTLESALLLLDHMPGE